MVNTAQTPKRETAKGNGLRKTIPLRSWVGCVTILSLHAPLRMVGCAEKSSIGHQAPVTPALKQQQEARLESVWRSRARSRKEVAGESMRSFNRGNFRTKETAASSQRRPLNVIS